MAKTAKIFGILVILFVLIIVARFLLIMKAKIPQPPSTDSPLLFHDDFNDDALANGWSGFQIATPKNFKPDACPAYKTDDFHKYILCSGSIALVADPARANNQVLKITVHPGDAAASGDAVKGKDRVELIRKGFGTEGAAESELWYRWSFLIPKDYQFNPTTDDLQIIGQLHLVGDEVLAPPVSINYGIKNNQSGIYVSYGLKDINKSKVAESFITLGKWVDVALHIKWSAGNDGFIEVYKNGQPISIFNGADYKVYGPNLPDKNSVAFFKLGLYRGHNIKTTNSIYFDEVKIGASQEAVR